MTAIIRFFVPGIPKPGGSKRGFVITPKGGGKPRAIVTEDCKTSKDWRASVALAAREAMEKAGASVETGTLAVDVTFDMPRPKSHYRTGKHAGELRDDAPDWHSKKPDATKLWRSTEDALTGVVWTDDALVASQYIIKRYAAPGMPTGADIHVYRLFL